MDRDDIIWLTGLFEGEGHIGARYNNRGGLCVQVSIAMTDADVVQRCQNATGLGSVRKVEKRAMPHWKDQWVWVVSGRRNVIHLLCAMAPLLGDRRRAKALSAAEMIQESWRRRPEYRKVAVCGTRSGADRHRRAGEPVCDACRIAENKASSLRRRNRRARQKAA